MPSPGRPVDKRSASSRQPWRAAGISKRTYYRRKAAGEDVGELHLFDAHVKAWLATLDSFARLDHRAYARRCASAAVRSGHRDEIYAFYLAAVGAN